MSELGHADLLNLIVLSATFSAFFLPLTVGLETVLGPQLVYGGMSCESTGEFAACTGVLPAGMGISIFISVFLALATISGLKRALGWQNEAA